MFLCTGEANGYPVLLLACSKLLLFTDHSYAYFREEELLMHQQMKGIISVLLDLV